MLRRSGSLALPPSLSRTLWLCRSRETLVGQQKWPGLAHAFWIARQIYAPPLDSAPERVTGSGSGCLRSVCLPASPCLCVYVCVAFINPLRVAVSVCVCSIAKNVVANLCVHYSF